MTSRPRSGHARTSARADRGHPYRRCIRPSSRGNPLFFVGNRILHGTKCCGVCAQPTDCAQDSHLRHSHSTAVAARKNSNPLLSPGREHRRRFSSGTVFVAVHARSRARKATRTGSAGMADSLPLDSCEPLPQPSNPRQRPTVQEQNNQHVVQTVPLAPWSQERRGVERSGFLAEGSGYSAERFEAAAPLAVWKGGCRLIG